ncbi:hypothetical protein F5I97DRAFT_1858500 [Phlebopus sp. FC_14]|nr:hypothetical protein F5I97DRAFT_1858500 [Phlebopus sp. FC_14]
MLRLNFFDDAVGEHDGFQIFKELIRHDDLRKRVCDCGITQVLLMKLRDGGSNEVRTSLICLDIFKAYTVHGCGTDHLVKKGMDLLNEDEWRIQKAGVTILSALARTDSGVESLRKHIAHIICMLLNDRYMPEGGSIHEESRWPITPPTEVPPSPPLNASSSDRASTSSSSSFGFSDDKRTRPSALLGPACALRALSTLETLRNEIRQNEYYRKLKDQWLSSSFAEGPETSPWKVHSPTKGDVLSMIEKMILSVEEGGFSEEGATSVGDLALPHIQHWDRLVAEVLGKGAGVVGALSSLPVLIGISALTVATAAVLLPLLVPVYTYELAQKLRWVQRRQTSHAMAGIMQE